eukprot:365534-Chlamydomonas_euryale.AAC.15
MIKVAGTIGKSNEVMKEVSALMRVPELQQSMMEMSKGAPRGLQLDFETCLPHLPVLISCSRPAPARAAGLELVLLRGPSTWSRHVRCVPGQGGPYAAVLPPPPAPLLPHPLPPDTRSCSPA